MDGRILAILAAGVLGFGCPAAAQSVAADRAEKDAPDVEPKPQLKQAELELQLAQRGDLKEPAAAVKRPRAARASSCRCGDLASQQR